MKISIIIPVYNVEKYLPTCIESILNQSYKDFEIILINDGSTDKSGMICDKYAHIDSRIKVFHKKNEGVSTARNLGLDHAIGEYICFIDSDDWLPSDYLEIILNDAKIADLTFWGLKLQYPDNLQTEYRPLDKFVIGKKEVEDCLAYLKFNNQRFEYLGYTVNKLFKSCIIKEYHIRFIENLSLREDEIFTLSYAKHIHSLRVKSSPLYNYRILNTGLTNRIKSKNEYLFFINELEKVLQHYHSEQLLLAEKHSILHYYFYVFASEPLFSKSWLSQLYNVINLGRILRDKNYIHSRKMKLIFKYNSRFYQYITAILIGVLKK